MNRRLAAVVVILLAPLLHSTSATEGTLQQKLAPRIQVILKWASDPVIVDAVVAQNRRLPSRYSDMTQPRWEALSRVDPFVVAFTTNKAGQFLRASRKAEISEAFLNDAAGYKVAFLSKPTNWQHRGKSKHDQPMAGKIWRGPIEIDASSATKQIQIAVPVLDQGKPVGSLVVGISVFELALE